jgi:hypothetical protein
VGQDDFRAQEMNTSRPHPARIYDYLLGGKDHYEVDQQTGDQLAAAAPEARIGLRANRAFLRRAPPRRASTHTRSSASYPANSVYSRTRRSSRACSRRARPWDRPGTPRPLYW